MDKSDEVTRKAQIENDENLISSIDPFKKAEEDSSEPRGARVNKKSSIPTHSIHDKVAIELWNPNNEKDTKERDISPHENQRLQRLHKSKKASWKESMSKLIHELKVPYHEDVKYELLRPDTSPLHSLQEQLTDENDNKLSQGKNKERSLEEAVNENEDYAYNEKDDGEDLKFQNDENLPKEKDNYVYNNEDHETNDEKIDEHSVGEQTVNDYDEYEDIERGKTTVETHVDVQLLHKDDRSKSLDSLRETLYSGKRHLPTSERLNHNEPLKDIATNAPKVQPIDKSNEQKDEINEADDFGFPAAERVMGESKNIGHKSKKLKKFHKSKKFNHHALMDSKSKKTSNGKKKSVVADMVRSDTPTPIPSFTEKNAKSKSTREAQKAAVSHLQHKFKYKANTITEQYTIKNKNSIIQKDETTDQMESDTAENESKEHSLLHTLSPRHHFKHALKETRKDIEPQLSSDTDAVTEQKTDLKNSSHFHSEIPNATYDNSRLLTTDVTELEDDSSETTDQFTTKISNDNSGIATNLSAEETTNDEDDNDDGNVDAASERNDQFTTKISNNNSGISKNRSAEETTTDDDDNEDDSSESNDQFTTKISNDNSGVSKTRSAEETTTDDDDNEDDVEDDSSERNDKFTTKISNNNSGISKNHSAEETTVETIKADAVKRPSKRKSIISDDFEQNEEIELKQQKSDADAVKGGDKEFNQFKAPSAKFKHFGEKTEKGLRSKKIDILEDSEKDLESKTKKDQNEMIIADKVRDQPLNKSRKLKKGKQKSSKKGGILSEENGENLVDLDEESDMSAEAVRDSRRRKVPRVKHPSNKLDMNEAWLAAEKAERLKKAKSDINPDDESSFNEFTILNHESHLKQRERKNTSPMQDHTSEVVGTHSSNEPLSVTILPKHIGISSKKDDFVLNKNDSLTDPIVKNDINQHIQVDILDKSTKAEPAKKHTLRTHRHKHHHENRKHKNHKKLNLPKSNNDLQDTTNLKLTLEKIEQILSKIETDDDADVGSKSKKLEEIEGNMAETFLI